MRFTASTPFADTAVTLARTLNGCVCCHSSRGRDPAVSVARTVAPAIGGSRGRASLSNLRIMTTVLFACVHNAGRSQMAAAWFNLLSNPAKARAISAGTDPGPRVHPEVVAAMREVGIDLTAAPTSKLTMELAQRAQMLVTMGCGDQCPVVPGLKRDDWPLEDPKGQPLARVREIRDEIRQRVEALLEHEGWHNTTGR